MENTPELEHTTLEFIGFYEDIVEYFNLQNLSVNVKHSLDKISNKLNNLKDIDEKNVEETKIEIKNMVKELENKLNADIA